MDTLFTNVLNGLTFSIILFLIASGLSIIFGFMGVFNLAHGVFYVLGAYLGLAFYSFGIPFILSALCAGIVVGLLGLFIERVFFSRLHNMTNEQVLLTLGFTYIFGNLISWKWGVITKIGSEPAFLSASVLIADTQYPLYRLVLIIFGLLLAIFLWIFTEKTRVGSIIRAGMDNKEMVTGLGINYSLTAAIVFFVGSLVGGFAGFIGLPIVAVNPDMIFQILNLSLVVIVVGGVGSIQGALLGSFIIGIIDTLGRAYFPDYAYFTMYILMILILLIKPSGLLGKRR